MKTLQPQWFLADRLKREDYYYTQYSNGVTRSSTSWNAILLMYYCS